MSSTAGASTTQRAPAVALDRELAAVLWLAVLALAAAISLFLTWRRLAGGLVQPPSGVALVIAAIVLASVAAVLRLLAREPRISILSTQYSLLSTQVANLLSLASPSVASRLLFSLPGVVAILVLAALTLAGTPAWSVGLAWFMLIGSEALSWLLHVRATRSRGQATPTGPLLDAEPSAVVDEPEIPAGLVQRLTRIREDDGESIHGLLRAEFAAHDRVTVVHIAFCPPLASRPELTAHAIDGIDAQTQVAQVETFGARIEVRRQRADDQPSSVLIEVLGSVTSPPGA